MSPIDKNIPVPPPRSSYTRHPWKEMEPGDSFFTPRGDTARLAGITSSAKRAVPGSRWATRTVEENGVRGVRVWRIS